MTRRCYQNIIVDGMDHGTPDPGRRDSAFWNEGKWKNFIEPFLPEDCSEMTFIDIGCNFGMYVKLARERGFRAIGVDGDKKLKTVTDKYLGPGHVIYQTLDQKSFRDNSIADLPAADFVLMANVHYHIFLPVFMHLVNLLRHKTRYVIVVSAKKPTLRHRIRADVETVRRHFRSWKEVGYIDGIPTDNDPAPREGMYSVMFQSDVERVPITEIRGWGTSRYRRRRRRFVEQSKDNPVPMTYPCLLNNDGELIDGHQRLGTLEASCGATTVLVERAW